MKNATECIESIKSHFTEAIDSSKDQVKLMDQSNQYNFCQQIKDAYD